MSHELGVRDLLTGRCGICSLKGAGSANFGLVVETYFPRAFDETVEALLAIHPALLVTGPRATGKTTTARQFARSVIELDRPEVALAVAADPDAALDGLARPTLIDEWQVVPEILGAVKRTVDRDGARGQFIVTGSVRGDLDSPTWPGTGRLVRLDMFGLTPAELSRSAPKTPLLDRISTGDLSELRIPSEAHNLRSYLALALASGFPEPALRLKKQADRARWLASYVEQLLTRDVAALDGKRDPTRLRRFFEVYALHSAGVADVSSLATDAGISRATADAYDHVLQNLFVAHHLPAWWSNRLKRLARSPKRVLVDAALVAAALRVDIAAIMLDANLMGRVLETFAVSQLRVDLSRCESQPRLFHLRDQDGRHEVDVVVEYGGGRVIGFEIKASAAPKPTDAKHLAWLAAELGDRFLGGVVLHSGSRKFPLGERIVAAPLSCLWG